MITPRNDFVLVRIIDKGETPSGIAVSDFSQEGKIYVVESVGSKVENLKKGDKVLVIGAENTTYSFLPNSRDMFIAKECFIPLWYENDDDVSGKVVSRIARK